MLIWMELPTARRARFDYLDIDIYQPGAIGLGALRGLNIDFDSWMKNQNIK